MGTEGAPPASSAAEKDVSKGQKSTACVEPREAATEAVSQEARDEATARNSALKGSG